MTMATEMPDDTAAASPVRRVARAGLVALFMLLVGGCVDMSSPSDASGELDGPALSDDQVRAQVVDPARQIVRAARLQGVSGSFKFGSCNDQNEPPFRGVAGFRFAVPTGTAADAYLAQVEAAMIDQGWSPGPPPGKVPHGRVVHQGEIMAILTEHQGGGRVQILGECRSMTDQVEAGGMQPSSITDELTS